MKQSIRAVSLIEILVVFSIMSIVGFAGFAGYSRFTNQKKWDKDIEAIQNVFMSAIQKTAARDVESGSCSTFSGYEIEITNSTGVFILYILCPSRREIARYQLSYSSVISLSTPIVHIYYPYGRLNETFSMVLQNAHAPECQEVSISTQGIITLPARYSC